MPKFHVHTTIDTVLSMSDREIHDLTEVDPKMARQELLERKAKGEILIGLAECDGFDPITGCPGHE